MPTFSRSLATAAATPTAPRLHPAEYPHTAIRSSCRKDLLVPVGDALVERDVEDALILIATVKGELLDELVRAEIPDARRRVLTAGNERIGQERGDGERSDPVLMGREDVSLDACGFSFLSQSKE